MYTKRNKEELINKLQKKIITCNVLKQFVTDVVFPTLKKFDGKVLNKRFYDTINNEIDGIYKTYNIFVRKVVYRELDIIARLDEFAYNECVTYVIRMDLDDDKRIDYDKIMNDKIGTAWRGDFDKNTANYKSTIDNYDKFMEVAERLESLIKEYNDLPYSFRDNIDKNYGFTIY